ncbi:hypothetical protein [Ralstonia pseudosolanacearum]|uniref:hypothetical protein n=1 Tax=Ralstonia pseudosolanacearum TaxID=1310165 RepID=UPI00049138FD|nr:hypothetical protein [Ralstonia pseudosolanacearum]MDO3579212.1 hypothetical protein [Ralstonia pseudosolanacearum]MDO3588987.1 hypothetical protein [Ralstonia pseudosolanacearum]
MTPTTDPHRTIAVLAEMLADYEAAVPSVYFEQFKKAVNTQIGRAKTELLLRDGPIHASKH